MNKNGSKESKLHSPDCEYAGGEESCDGNIVSLACYAECMCWKTKDSDPLPSWCKPRRRTRAALHLYQITKTGMYNQLVIQNLKIRDERNEKA